MKFLLVIVLFYLLWRILKPYFSIFTDSPGVRKAKEKHKPKIDLDKSDIEDAKFTEINDSEPTEKNSKTR